MLKAYLHRNIFHCHEAKVSIGVLNRILRLDLLLHFVWPGAQKLTFGTKALREQCLVESIHICIAFTRSIAGHVTRHHRFAIRSDWLARESFSFC